MITSRQNRCEENVCMYVYIYIYILKNVLFFREFLENEQSQQLQQANVEEQLNTVRQSLQDHNSAAQSLQSELRAQLENIQKKVTQVTCTQANHK